MNPEHTLDRLDRWAEALLHAAEPHDGLMPSLLDPNTHEMLRALPEPIEGQRQCDRAPLGSNLMHDHTTLHVLYALAGARDRPDYSDLADAYLRRFAEHCTDTVTGLFPWGEHAFWQLADDRVASGHAVASPSWTRGAVHDHLRQAPVWLWEKLWKANPRCVERFGEGLEYHFQEGEPREYIRHALIERRERFGRGEKSADFPRHGGFYTLDWSFTYARTGRPCVLDQIREMVDYWWPHRDAHGLLLVHSRAPADDPKSYQINHAAQTLSLASSLLESANLVEARQPQLAEIMRARAKVYIDGFLAAPHDLEGGRAVTTFRRSDGEVLNYAPIWGSVYGLWPAGYIALICLCAYRLTDDERLLRWAEAVGRHYGREPFPSGRAVPAMDAGMATELLADLYELTEDQAWLRMGHELADALVPIYLQNDLPVGAAGIDWYESQMGPGDLMHGLARLALRSLAEPDQLLAPNYTGR